MPPVQPLHLPRVEGRVNRLGACVHGVRSEGLAGRRRRQRAWTWTHLRRVDHFPLKTYARVGTVRLDYCNACDSVTMVDDSSTN